MAEPAGSGCPQSYPHSQFLDSAPSASRSLDAFRFTFPFPLASPRTGLLVISAAALAQKHCRCAMYTLLHTRQTAWWRVQMPPPLRWHFPFPPAFSPPQWCLVPRMSFWACCVGSATKGLGRDLRVRDLWELEVDLAIVMVWRGR